MRIMFSLVVVLLLALVAYLGTEVAGLQFFFGGVLPYFGAAVFLIFVVYRVIKWARSPVPFHITTTCGQQKSLPWIKSSYVENPHTKLGVLFRMALEVLFFRSLFRNTKMELRDGPKVVYGSNYWLWLFGLVFHWTFLLVLLRHLRFFTEPVPGFVMLLQDIDGFLQIGVPVVYITSLLFIGAVTLLFLRRLFSPQLRYISLPADYFPLLLIIGIAFTGILLRHFAKTDVVAVKELTMGLLSLSPTAPEGISYLFYIHLFFVTVLFAYFPFSKLMHMGGVFLSPTRNLTGNSREVRHVNPWNYPVKVHTYEEYEDDFREKMVKAGLPVERPLEPEKE